MSETVASDIGPEQIHQSNTSSSQPQQQYHCDNLADQLSRSTTSSSVWEIEEEKVEDEFYGSSSRSSQIGPVHDKTRENFPMMPVIKEEQYDHDDDIDACVYVAVGKSESSMDALNYAVKQLVPTSNRSLLYLIHIFPEIKFIPTPLGKLPRSQVSPEQVESFMSEEAAKRRQLLHKYIDVCSAAKTTVDTLLIESDMIGKAIVDLIPVLNIRKLVLGTSKSNSRKLMSGKGASRIADQVLQGAPQSCEVNIICQGNRVMIYDSLLSPRSDSIPAETLSLQGDEGGANPQSVLDDSQRNEPCSFLCFKPKFSHSSK